MSIRQQAMVRGRASVPGPEPVEPVVPSPPEPFPEPAPDGPPLPDPNPVPAPDPGPPPSPIPEPDPGSIPDPAPQMGPPADLVPDRRRVGRRMASCVGGHPQILLHSWP
jgi:hypothetical protein